MEISNIFDTILKNKLPYAICKARFNFINTAVDSYMIDWFIITDKQSAVKINEKIKKNLNEKHDNKFTRSESYKFLYEKTLNSNEIRYIKDNFENYNKLEFDNIIIYENKQFPLAEYIRNNYHNDKKMQKHELYIDNYIKTIDDFQNYLVFKNMINPENIINPIFKELNYMQKTLFFYNLYNKKIETVNYKELSELIDTINGKIFNISRSLSYTFIKMFELNNELIEKNINFGTYKNIEKKFAI